MFHCGRRGGGCRRLDPWGTDSRRRYSRSWLDGRGSPGCRNSWSVGRDCRRWPAAVAWCWGWRYWSGVTLHCTCVGAGLPGLFPHDRGDRSSGEGRRRRGHDRGHPPLLLPPGTVWCVGSVGAAAVDTSESLAVRLVWVGLAASDAAAWPAAGLLHVAVPAALPALQWTRPGWSNREAYPV